MIALIMISIVNANISSLYVCIKRSNAESLEKSHHCTIRAYYTFIA